MAAHTAAHTPNITKHNVERRMERSEAPPLDSGASLSGGLMEESGFGERSLPEFGGGGMMFRGGLEPPSSSYQEPTD